jgi:hypothetical protein
LTTPGDKPPDEQRQPIDATPDLSNPDRFGALQPPGSIPPPPKPVQPLDYASRFSKVKPRPGLLIGSIACGMASVVAAIVTFACVANAIGGPYSANIGLAAACIALAACIFGMVRVFGGNRAAGGIVIGFLLLVLIGCAGLAMICGVGRFH